VVVDLQPGSEARIVDALANNQGEKERMQEVTVGIGGAAGDGLDKSGDTLAKTAGRLGLHVYAYNSYQSIIRGGHIWLRVRIGADKVYNHGDKLTALIALNQDTIERHAGEVDDNGFIVFNSEKLKCDPSLPKASVQVLGMPMSQVTAEVAKEHGAIQPIMQNTVMVGAVIALTGLDFEVGAEVLKETFAHKGDKIIDLNISLLRAGYDWALANAKATANNKWTFSRKRRPFVTGNEAIAIAAAAAGCKFYSAYPMTPASTILHWMANHAEKAGVCVKQAEDELAVINMAIGAGIGGVRSMCGTAGGGFALMTEAIGMAGIMEVPVVCVEVQRGGPSTGLPTKTEQADLNQVYGASQGDFPRMIVAPKDLPDCFETTVEAFHVADKYQMPVLIMSDLLLSEHPETVEPEVFRHNIDINRGKLVTEWTEGKTFKRFTLETENGVSPRSIPGVANALYTSGSDEHDEQGILISDMFTTQAVRRKMFEKRQSKLEYLLKDLPAPKVEGPADADVTIVGWGSTYGVIREAAELLNQQGIKTNYVIGKYLLPFHVKEWTELLGKAKKRISVEVNFTSQFARLVRAETGIGMDAHVNKYDGEPMEPNWVVQEIKNVLANKPVELGVTEEEAKDMAYHYLRTHYTERLRPGKTVKESKNGKGESVWRVELVERATGNKAGEIVIGAVSGSTYSFETVGEPVKAASK
jgi:2-oxoglutarate ferredoxin oxidoreductase subunit alpha